jgi:hypothetical protein
MQDAPELGCRVSIVGMDDSDAGSLEQIRAFLAGSGGVRFAGKRREEVCGWTERTLVRQTSGRCRFCSGHPSRCASNLGAKR